MGKMVLNLFRRPVPPLHFQQCRYLLFRKPPADWFCRNAACNGIRRNILCHQGTGANDCAVSNGHAGEDDGVLGDPHVIADDNISLIVPGFGYLLHIQIPLLKKDRERIGGQGPFGVIGAGE